MDKRELILNTKKKLDEINEKIRDIKMKVDETSGEELEKQSKRFLETLEGIQDSIKEQYSDLTKPERPVRSKVSEIEKNIFNSIDSFDSAFTNAGSIFKTK